jgi:hypothetical protein
LKRLLARFVRQSPAMAVAMLALFVAMGGTAIAAGSALITGKQIKNSSITGADVKNKSLTPKDFRGSVRGPRGLQGPKGDKGDKGDTGAPGAPNPNAANSDRLDGLDSTAFLRNTEIAMSYQRGWLVQNGDTGVVRTFANLQTLEGNGRYYLPLATPNSIGVQRYYLQTMTLCYNAFAAGDRIDVTRVSRSSTENFVDQTFTDATDRTSVFPTTECYNLAVNDSAAPAGSVYTADISVVGSIRLVRITGTFAAS